MIEAGLLRGSGKYDLAGFVEGHLSGGDPASQNHAHRWLSPIASTRFYCEP